MNTMPAIYRDVQDGRKLRHGRWAYKLSCGHDMIAHEEIVIDIREVTTESGDHIVSRVRCRLCEAQKAPK